MRGFFWHSSFRSDHGEKAKILASCEFADLASRYPAAIRSERDVIALLRAAIGLRIGTGTVAARN
jgi:hypothetical protein